MKRIVLFLMILALAVNSACTLQKKPTMASSDYEAASMTISPTSTPITSQTSETEPTSTSTSTNAAANPVTGLWTDDPSGMPVTLNDQGLPVGDIYEGEWYSFRSDGTFFRLYYSSGISVSGILIQEGFYQVSQNSIYLTSCTESFFRDLWEEQPEYYRVMIEDRTLQYRLARLQGQPVVYITSPVRGVEQLYFQAME